MSMIKNLTAALMGVAYVLAGANHFVNPAFYMPMMPPWIPAHSACVAISGIAEMVFGIAVIIPRFRVPAAFGIIALLIAVFPANIHIATANVQLPGFEDMPSWAPWARLPLQGLLIVWAWWYTLED
jgi:uncharacterized membrane protein